MTMGAEAFDNKDTDRFLMKVYFLPFTIETYVPVTIDNIKTDSSNKIWFSYTHMFHKYMQEILEKNKGKTKINKLAIRMKVEFVNKNNFIYAQYYVDRDGKVLKNNGETFLLSQMMMREIEEKIAYFSGVVDIIACKEFGAVK